MNQEEVGVRCTPPSSLEVEIAPFEMRTRLVRGGVREEGAPSSGKRELNCTIFKCTSTIQVKREGQEDGSLRFAVNLPSLASHNNSS